MDTFENNSKDPLNPLINRKRTLFLLLFVNILRSMGGSAISIGLPSLVLELAGSLTLYGLTLGVFQFVQTFFQIPNASLSDKFGRRTMIFIGYFIYLVGTFLCGFATTLPQLIVYRAIQGAGAFSSIIMASITDLYNVEERGRVLSYYSASLTLGYILGNVVGGLIVDWFSIRNLFFYSTAANLIGFLLLVFLLPETNIKRTKFDHNIEIHEEKSIKKIKQLINGPFVFGVSINGIRQLLFSGFLAYTIWNLRILFNLTGIQTSLYLIPLTIIYIFGLILSPKLEKKSNYFIIIIISCLILIVENFLTAIWINLTFYFIAAIFFSFAVSLQDPITTSFTTRYIPDSQRGLGSGIYASVSFLLGAMGQILIPALGERLDFSRTHMVGGLIWGVLLFLNVIMYFYMKKRGLLKNFNFL